MAPVRRRTFSFRLDQAARVTLRFTRSSTGRRVGWRCVRQTAGNRHRSRCVRSAPAGSVAFAGRAR